MDNPSWSEGCFYYIKTCFSCMAPTSQDEGGDLFYRERIRQRGFSDIESLLADASDVEGDAEVMSLHSNIGESVTRRPRRKKSRTKRRGVKLFGLNLFGHHPIQLTSSDDEDDFIITPARRVENNGSLSHHSSSTLDSDAAPLDPNDIARLTSTKADDNFSIQDDSDDSVHDQQHKLRREREPVSQPLAISSGEHEFEGFQGSGDGAANPSHPSVLLPENNISSNVFSASTLYGQAARLFEAYVQSAVSGLPSASSSDEQGEFGCVDDDMPDFDLESYSRASGSKSSASGSNSLSHTSPSQTSYDYHSTHETQYDPRYLTLPQLPPQTPMSIASDRFDDANSSVYFTPTSESNLTPHRHMSKFTSTTPKKSKSKSRSSRKSSSSSSQSPSIASPTPIHPSFSPFTSIRTDDSDIPVQDFADLQKNADETYVETLLEGNV